MTLTADAAARIQSVLRFKSLLSEFVDAFDCQKPLIGFAALQKAHSILHADFKPNAADAIDSGSLRHSLPELKWAFKWLLEKYTFDIRATPPTTELLAFFAHVNAAEFACLGDLRSQTHADSLHFAVAENLRFLFEYLRLCASQEDVAAVLKV